MNTPGQPSPASSSGGWQDTALDLLRKHWVPLVLVIAAIIFITQNRDDVGITLLWIDVTAPLWVVLTILFVGGFLAGLFRGRRRRRDR